jgi:hypothetical protein
MSPAFVLFGFGKQSGRRAVDGWIEEGGEGAYVPGSSE